MWHQFKILTYCIASIIYCIMIVKKWFQLESSLLFLLRTTTVGVWRDDGSCRYIQREVLHVHACGYMYITVHKLSRKGMRSGHENWKTNFLADSLGQEDFMPHLPHGTPTCPNKKQKFEFANRNHAPSKGAQCALDMLCAQITTLENRSTV